MIHDHSNGVHAGQLRQVSYCLRGFPGSARLGGAGRVMMDHAVPASGGKVRILAEACQDFSKRFPGEEPFVLAASG